MSEVGKPHNRSVTPRGASVSARPQPQVKKKPEQPVAKGASQSEINTRNKTRSWLRHHRMMAIDSLWRVIRTPFSSLMTWAVLAIALALPTGLYLFLSNAQVVTSNWDGSAQVSLFLKMEVSESQAQALRLNLETRTDIASVAYISKDQAMKEFKQFSGFGEALDYLDDNPLPSVLVVRPANTLTLLNQQEALFTELGKMPEVEEAQLDMDWVKRLYHIMELSQRAVSALAILLGIAVLLVVGNTIRLAIESRRDEIVIVKLVGGSDAFIRRPFLYTGIWYGLGGGLLAWWIINISLLWLEDPVNALASAYDASSFELIGLGAGDSLLLILTSTLLGWLGAWLAVSRHLGDIEPR
ncbi:MAG: cell division protein FtsX [Oceanospirillum sp.]|nr:cell division protein FtsX [Oceanospirillum sp.]